MTNSSKKLKGFTDVELEQYKRTYDGLVNVKDRVARHAVAGMVVKDMHDLDIGV